MMRPWAMWLINHNMRFVVYLTAVLVFPIVAVLRAMQSVLDTLEEFKDLFKTIKDQNKVER